MRHVLLLLLITASYARAQTPEELLQLAQDTYKSPEGYHIEGRGSVQPFGSSWQVKFNVKLRLILLSRVLLKGLPVPASRLAATCSL